MAHRRVQVVFASLTGVPADSVVNTWHFTTANTTTDATEHASIRDALVQFYGTNVSVGGGSYAVKVFLAGLALSPVITIKVYRCETEVGVGVSMEPLVTYSVDLTTLGAGAGGLLPEEAAVCLSFKGTLDTSIPAARQRGRVFLGPLVNSALSVVNNRTRVHADFRATLAGSAARLRDWSTAGVDWVVWSHTALQAFPVTAGWIDDAFDTQRRRGPKASLRTTW